MSRVDAKNPLKIARVRKEREQSGAAISTPGKTKPFPPNDFLFSDPSQSSAGVRRAAAAMTQSLDASGATWEELKRQGASIEAAAREVAIVRDAAKHAERVSRATEITGLLRNALTPYPSSSSATDHSRPPLGYQRRDNNSEEDSEKKTTTAGDEEDEGRVGALTGLAGEELPTLETLEKMCEDQLVIAAKIQSEVEEQHTALETISQNYDEAEDGVRGVVRKNFRR